MAIVEPFHGKLMEIIGLEAPGNYSASIWIITFRFAYGGTENHHFCDFGIFEPVTKPPNQLFHLWRHQVT